MKVKYVRTKEGNFYKTGDIDKSGREIKIGRKWVTFYKSGPFSYYKVQNEIIKVADTPQELIEEMDIGFIEEWNTYETLHTSNDGAYCYMDGKRHFIGKDITITKILTPNSNDGYDLQWEVEYI